VHDLEGKNTKYEIQVPHNLVLLPRQIEPEKIYSGWGVDQPGFRH
jgi:hypothetical protein